MMPAPETILASFSLVVATAGAAAAPPAAPVVASPPAWQYAVLPFVFSPPHRDLQWLTEALPEAIGERLDRLGFTVASRRERIEVAESAGVASASPLTLAGRVKLARALRAARAVTGTLRFEPAKGSEPASARITVQSMVVDLGRGAIIHRRTITGTLNELFSMIDEIALETAWQDPSPAGPEARRILRELDVPPLPSFETVMRAVTEKDPDRQNAAIDSALAAARDHPVLVRRLADAMVEAGRVDEGLARLQTIDPGRLPDPWRLHLDVAEVLLAKGELDAAGAAAARSVSLRDTAPAHIVLARVALARGDTAAASTEARLAAALDPGHPSLPGLLQQIAGASPAEDPAPL